MIYKNAIIFSTLFGTSFKEADLTGANFSDSVLENSDFSGSQITKISWRNSRYLNRARVGNSYLADSDILKLITTGKAQEVKLNNRDLRGINLDHTILRNVSFLRSDLTGASLRNSTLFEVNLSYENLN